MNLDTKKLKEMILDRWRVGGEDTLVKVFPKGTRISPSHMTGYCTTIKYIAGRTPAEIELIVGFKEDTKLKDGAEVFTVNPLPSIHQFELRGYSQTPAGIAQIDGVVVNPLYPPGRGAPQWELSRYPQSGLRWLATLQPDQRFICRYADLPTGLPTFIAASA